jgi:uncharacterized protein (TIGR03435 family)
LSLGWRRTARPVGASFNIGPGGRLTASGATLRDLVVRAYDAQDFQVVGGEPWVSRARSLLQERFGLTVHRETRNLPIFALVLASQPDLRLRKSTHDCRGVLEDRDPLDVSEVSGELAGCQPKTTFVAGAGGSQISFARPGMSIRQLASLIMPFAKRTVIDRTGLKGTYDIELTFSFDPFFVTQSGIQQAPQTEGMSLATALREQLGLKLESTRGPSEVVVIDAAHQPSPD